MANVLGRSCVVCKRAAEWLGSRTSDVDERPAKRHAVSRAWWRRASSSRRLWRPVACSRGGRRRGVGSRGVAHRLQTGFRVHGPWPVGVDERGRQASRRFQSVVATGELESAAAAAAGRVLARRAQSWRRLLGGRASSGNGMPSAWAVAHGCARAAYQASRRFQSVVATGELEGTHPRAASGAPHT